MIHMRRKGQFFIISAVVILIILFSLNSEMNTEWNADVSDEQAGDAAAILGNLEDGINSTVSASPPEKLKENLEKFGLAEKNSLRDKYSLNVLYTVEPSYVTANITLKSSSLYAEKTIVVDR